MYFYPKAILKFNSELSKDELISKIKSIPNTDSVSTFLFSRLKAENRFEIIVTQNGFELWEKIMFFFSVMKFYRISNADWNTIESGTEIEIEVRPPNWFLILQLAFGLIIAIVPTYFLYLIAGFAALLWPCFIYLAFTLHFSFQVWQIEDLVIHKICAKKVKKIQP